jgi:hypothetical protein
MIVGIDPGLDGAFAFLDPEALRIVAVVEMATLIVGKRGGTRREISPATLLAALRQAQSYCNTVVEAFLETAQPMPGQGVSSSFKFGRGYGAVEMAVTAMGWSISYVTAAAWKKTLGVPAAKDDARARASQLLPLDAEHWTPHRGTLTKVQAAGNAEAALIALYGLRRLGGAKLERAA